MEYFSIGTGQLLLENRDRCELVLREGYARVSFGGARCDNALKKYTLPRGQRYCAIARPEGARPNNAYADSFQCRVFCQYVFMPD